MSPGLGPQGDEPTAEPADTTASWAAAFGRPWRSVGWSTAYLLVSRLSSLAAVPLLLTSLGADLYAAWVLAGSLVMAQGLVDLGMGAAVVRFVSEASVRGADNAVAAAARRGVLFFAVLGLAVAVPLWIGADELASAAAFGSESTDAAVLIRYAAATFLLTNLTMSLGWVLQGAGRVDTSYRAQTIGWLLYVPVLALGLSAVADVQAAGLAWVATYLVQLALLAPACTATLRRRSGGPGHVPRLAEMLSFGGRWQVSTWADFATFQLPRIVSPFLLTGSAVVSVDLALRFGQAAVTPLFAVYPILLPAFSRIWASQGPSGLRDGLWTWYRAGAGWTLLGLAIALPLSVPAIATWTGRDIDQVDVLVTCAVLVGVVAHASTGLFTNAWLAVGRLRMVIRYKAWQLGLAAVLVTGGALIGQRELGVALGISLALPALSFNRASARELGLNALGKDERDVRRFAVTLMVAFGGTLLAVLATASSGAVPWLVLLAGLVAAAGAGLPGFRYAVTISRRRATQTTRHVNV